MKKILKLRGEIIIIGVLSIILAFIGTIIISNCLSATSIGKKIDYNRIIENSKLQYMIDEFKSEKISELDLEHAIKTWNNQFINIYMVDSSGNVIASKEQGITNINLDEINDRTEIESNDNNITQFCGKISLDSDRLIVYYCSYYPNDSRNGIIMVVLTVLLFLFFIRGRVNYIVKINDSITDIANGNFKKRISIKYNNELRELAENINIMANSLEQEDLKKKEFITNISHDLRTPLTTILGYLNILYNEKYDSKEELREYINIINNKGIYLKSLLDDFFTYSKLNSNDINVSYCDIDCKLFLEQILIEEKNHFKKRDLNLNFECDDDKYIINADCDLVARAFYNLISNAFKYSKKNTDVVVTINKEVYNQNNYICISIINVPQEKMRKEEIDKLFERLYKIDGERSSNGSGLGLTITKEIMNLHNGFIKAEIVEDKIRFKLVFIENKSFNNIIS